MSFPHRRPLMVLLVLGAPVFAAPAAAQEPQSAAVAATAATACPGADLMPVAANAAQVRRATLCLLNRERRAHGLRPLRAERTLRGVATRYARHMVAARFFDHVSPRGSTMLSRIRSTSYLRRAADWSLGENLAWGSGFYATPAETVKSWMGSAGHRANILHGGFRDVGIGLAVGCPMAGDDGGATYVTEFGRRTR